MDGVWTTISGERYVPPVAFSDPSLRDIEKFADYRDALREAVKGDKPRSRLKPARARRANRDSRPPQR